MRRDGISRCLEKMDTAIRYFKQMTIDVFGLFARVCARKGVLATYNDVCMLVLYLLVLVRRY